MPKSTPRFQEARRTYSLAKRLPRDKTHPTVILMPLLPPDCSARDLSYLLTEGATRLSPRPIVADNQSPTGRVVRSPLQNTAGDEDGSQTVDSAINADESAATAGAGAASTSKQTPPQVHDNPEACPYDSEPRRRMLIRVDASHYWYTSKGPTSLDKPPPLNSSFNFNEDLVFAHWNYTTSERQFWWRSKGQQSDWTPLAFGDQHEFGGVTFFFSWTQQGDPSWVRRKAFGRKEKVLGRKP